MEGIPITEIIGLLALIIVLTYLVNEGKYKKSAVIENHQVWQSWLAIERAARENSADERQKLLLAELNRWRDIDAAQEDIRLAKWSEMTDVIAKLERRMDHLGNVILLIYAAVKTPNVDLAPFLDEALHKREGDL
jgi:hypothetical protein